MPGSAVLQLGLVWQAKQAVAEKKAAEEAEKVRSSRALDGFGLRRTASGTCACVEWQQCYYSHRGALCRTRAVRLRLRVRVHGGGWARLRVRSNAVVADKTTPLRTRHVHHAHTRARALLPHID